MARPAEIDNQMSRGGRVCSPSPQTPRPRSPNRVPAAKSNFLSVVVAGAGVLLAAAAKNVEGSPIMTIQHNYVNDSDQDDTRPGQQSWFNYLVKNESAAGDINNMIDLTLPAGSNQGVYNDFIVVPNGWSYHINANDTYFQGLIVPGSQGTFELMSDYNNVTTGTASATASGTIAGTIPYQ